MQWTNCAQYENYFHQLRKFRIPHSAFMYTLWYLADTQPGTFFSRNLDVRVKLGKRAEKGFVIRACLEEKLSQLLSIETWLPACAFGNLCRLFRLRRLFLPLFDIMFETEHLSLCAKITKRRVWWPCPMTSQGAKAELKIKQRNARSTRSIFCHNVN